MKALRSFTVRPSLPRSLAALEELAFNLRWSWDDQTRALFHWVDPDLWDASVHDPVRMLGLVSREHFEALAADPGFTRYLVEVREELRRYLEGDRWFQARGESPLRKVAYFSPEFGIAEAVPQYSGGLGVLAGDHLKSSSDLGVPLVGVGLLYRHGYFRQSLDTAGWQQERYPSLDPHVMALTRCDGVRVTVDLAGVPLVAQVWKADVGRVPLYFLDADVEDNDDRGREVTDRLYGGDTEHRLRQEVLLGIGGVRALAALGIDAQVFHTNEGHAGFLGLERIRELTEDLGKESLSFEAALEVSRAGTVFTTHTPVPAGIDRFPRELVENGLRDVHHAARRQIGVEHPLGLGEADCGERHGLLVLSAPGGKLVLDRLQRLRQAGDVAVAEYGEDARKERHGLAELAPVAEGPRQLPPEDRVARILGDQLLQGGQGGLDLARLQLIVRPLVALEEIHRPVDVLLVEALAQERLPPLARDGVQRETAGDRSQRRHQRVQDYD